MKQDPRSGGRMSVAGSALPGIEGLVLAGTEAGLALAPQARAGAAEHLVDVLVALHALDPVAVGLGDMVRKTAYGHQAENCRRSRSVTMKSSGLCGLSCHGS
jgi:hypothetical protein